MLELHRAIKGKIALVDQFESRERGVYLDRARWPKIRLRPSVAVVVPAKYRAPVFIFSDDADRRPFFEVRRNRVNCFVQSAVAFRASGWWGFVVFGLQAGEAVQACGEEDQRKDFHSADSESIRIGVNGHPE